ncbi:MAG: macro domain-containing protein [Chloroflexota bacterium]|nr:macro domain-containing protein [Chloroflexota bacterium]
MITCIEGSLFTSTAQTLVNTVNTAGVMGKGLARAFKTYYPAMFAEYAQLCAEKQFAPGQLLLYRTPHKWAVNFPTKRHWRQPSRLADIDAGLETFVRTYSEQGISSIAFPQLGCGNGGLDWEGQVRPLMEQYLGELPLDVQVFITPEQSDSRFVDEGLIAEWLHSDGQFAGYAAFRNDVEALPGLSGIDDDVRWGIWRQLCHEGVVLPEDLGEPGHALVHGVIAALGALPYIRPVRAARISTSIAYDAPTQALFERAEAQGAQFVPPLFWKLHGAPDSLNVELEPGCSESQTTRQLALSLPS